MLSQGAALKNVIKQKAMTFFQKFFQLSKQDGHGYHINNEDQFWKFWPNGPFCVEGHSPLTCTGEKPWPVVNSSNDELAIL